MGEIDRLLFSEEVTIYPFPYVEGVPSLKVSVSPEERKRVDEIKKSLKEKSIVGIKAKIKIPRNEKVKEFVKLLVSDLNGEGEVEGTLYVTTKKGWGTFSLEKENPSIFFSEFLQRS
jgi:hypothetical protein